MEQDQFQSYEEGTAYKPGKVVDVIPALDRINSRLNSADQAALAQVQANNRTRVANSKLVGQDLIALSKMSKKLTDTLVKRQEGINEDQRAEGNVAGQQQWERSQLDTSEYDAGAEAAKQQDGVVQDVVAEVLGESGENYEAAARLGKATTHYEVGRRQGFASAAVANFDNYVNQRVPPQNYNTSEDYAAARALAQKEFYKEAGLTGLNPQFLAQKVYPVITDSNAAAMRQWSKTFAIEDSDKTRDEQKAAFLATKDIPTFLGTVRNTVNAQGKPLGYKGAWDEFDSMLVELRKAGLISDADIENMKRQPIPGDPKGRTYGELHEAKFENIQRQVDAQQITDWNRSQAESQMIFQKEEKAAIDSFLDPSDTDGYTDKQIEDAAKALEKKYGMPASKLRILAANSVDADVRDKQETEIKSLIKLNLLTPERLLKYDPKLQARYSSIAGQTAKRRKESEGYDAFIKEKVEFLVQLDKQAANNPAVGMFVTKMQQEYQQEVTRLALTGDPDPAGTAYKVITDKLDAAVKNMAGNPKQIIQFYHSQTVGKLGTPAGDTAARFAGIQEALKTPNSIEDSYLLKPEELKAAVKGYGKPGFSPGRAVEFIAQRLNVDPLTVLNKQLELNGMDALPPTPAMEVVNKLTPQQQQLLHKFKTPERSSRGFGGTGKYDPAVVPGGYGEMIQKSAQKHGIPPSIVAGLIETESAWNPKAVSPVGAKGLAQFMDPTAAEFGVSPYNPQSAIDGAAKYLKYLVDFFNGDMRLAIFAYNGGMGNIKRYGGPIPGNAENQDYYGKVMRGAYKYGYGKQSLQDPAVMRPSIAAQIPS